MSWGLERDYFERIYADDDDPWRFESAWYERRKRALTMALLSKERYACAFEPGCASGELTRLLSERVDQVIALELLPRIAGRAKGRLADLGNVEVREGSIPRDWPEQRFDLILLSEVLYYLNEDGLREVAHRIEETLAPGGEIVAVHYLGETDYPLAGAAVQPLLCEALAYTTVATYNEPEFSAFVLRR